MQNSLKLDLSYLFTNSKLDNYSKIIFLFFKSFNYQSSPVFFLIFDTKLNLSSSGLNTYIKYSTKPITSLQSYYYTLATLTDFLTKREILYKQYLELNNNLIYIPYDISNTFKNPLFEEIKTTFNLNDPLLLRSEYSRELYINSLQFFNLFLLFTNFPFCIFPLEDPILYYFFGSEFLESNFNKFELQKNPYRPLKKGLTNMLRLHATGAVALPIEVRLQVLASSRDVIHS
jgi:hypothetical protein